MDILTLWGREEHAISKCVQKDKLRKFSHMTVWAEMGTVIAHYPHNQNDFCHTTVYHLQCNLQKG